MDNIKTCTHTKDDGSPCQAISLRGKHYCYFHRRYYESTTLPGDKNYQPPLLESNHSIILATTDLYRAFLARKMGMKEVALGMQLLRLAAKAIADIERAERKKAADHVMDAGRLRPASDSATVATTPAVRLTEVVNHVNQPVTSSSGASQSSINNNHPQIDNQTKSRYYDPEGCLSHLTRANGA